MPWAPYELGFAQCPVAEACLGLSDSRTRPRVFPYNASDSLDALWASQDFMDRPDARADASMVPEEEEACRTGHRGVLCSACAPNYFPGVGGVCTACGNRAWIAGRFVLLVMAVLVVFSGILIRAWKSRSSSSSKEVQIVKIVVSHMQSVAIVGAVQLQWPGGAKEMFSVADAASSFTTSGLAIECLMGRGAANPFARTVVVVLLPLALVVFAALFWLILGATETRNERVRSLLQTQISTDSVNDATAKPTDEHGWQRTWRDRMLISLLVIGFLVHTPLSSSAFRLLTCRPVAPEDDASAKQLRLSIDLDVLCTDPSNLGAMLGIAIPVLVLVSLGIPIASALFLRSIGPKRLALPVWSNLLGFLINGYRPELYFWESVILLRKVLLAFVTTTLAPAGAGMQIATATVVILVGLVLHARFHPFQSGVINALESLALVTAGLTLVGGIFVVLDEANIAGTAEGSAGPTASVMIAIINILFVLTAILLLSKRMRRQAMVWYGRLVASMRSAMHADELDAHDGLHGTFQSVVRRTMTLRGEPAPVTTSPSFVAKGGFEQANPMVPRKDSRLSRSTSGPSVVGVSQASK